MTQTLNDNTGTLLSVGDKYGFQSCDVKCYDAQEPACDCVCGGKNHGVGLKQAIAFTLDRKTFYERMYGRKLKYGELVMAKIMNFRD